MKSYEEMAASVLQRSRKLLAEKERKRRKAQRTAAVVSCCCLTTLLGLGLWNGGLFHRPLPALHGDNADSALPSSVGDGPSSSTGAESNRPQGGAPSQAPEDNPSQKENTSDSSGGDEPQDDPPGGDGPHAVFSRIPATYEEAVRLFGHPLPECTRQDFLGYELGVVSPKGDVQSGSAFCLSVLYLFEDGEIELTDQNRLPAGGHIGYEDCTTQTYQGVTFWKDSANHMVYFPLQDRLLLTAVFRDREWTEIYDLLMELSF